ncbi:hypothetical protein [Vibrio splendidus]|uniref:hypothetical protein n=1 Tax=Vibrio splendidus TaxID=29497 RepID=UPI003D0B9A87
MTSPSATKQTDIFKIVIFVTLIGALLLAVNISNSFNVPFNIAMDSVFFAAKFGFLPFIWVVFNSSFNLVKSVLTSAPMFLLLMAIPITSFLYPDLFSSAVEKLVILGSVVLTLYLNWRYD